MGWALKSKYPPGYEPPPPPTPASRRSKVIIMLIFGVIPLVIAGIELLTERNASHDLSVRWLVSLVVFLTVWVAAIRGGSWLLKRKRDQNGIK